MLYYNKVKLIDIMQWGEWARVEFVDGSYTDVPMYKLKECKQWMTYH